MAKVSLNLKLLRAAFLMGRRRAERQLQRERAEREQMEEAFSDAMEVLARDLRDEEDRHRRIEAGMTQLLRPDDQRWLH